MGSDRVPNGNEAFRPMVEAGDPPLFEEAPPATNTPMDQVHMTGAIARNIGGERLRVVVRVAVIAIVAVIVIALVVS